MTHERAGKQAQQKAQHCLMNWERNENTCLVAFCLQGPSSDTTYRECVLALLFQLSATKQPRSRFKQEAEESNF